ncbi:MarR family transcriptional regulator [Putridiphycobacter roseus]|uniref:HTH-type transcriptional regulator SarZ n=1 Tax=Putridiphycobacter roseus TaxID=2219161 RepID=A0A2W1N2T9_9FLAO|nr:MarR family transcriptional regulator [Putridiphycobacter roseus]PZE18627.1 MarR family transcriptional regulator [Putridiphycobacter roseus]
MSDKLKLANQVCFPIYTLSKEVINHYRPLLKELDLTYPQYLVMLVLWEEGEQNVSTLGAKLNLDSGTLTPLLKRLANKNLIERNRKATDERVVSITLTAQGKLKKKAAQSIPSKIASSLNVSTADLAQLKKIIDQIITQINKEK